MTSPVLVKMPDKKSFWRMGTYTMSFLLPAEHQANPPKPTDGEVSFLTKHGRKNLHFVIMIMN